MEYSRFPNFVGATLFALLVTTFFGAPANASCAGGNSPCQPPNPPREPDYYLHFWGGVEYVYVRAPTPSATCMAFISEHSGQQCFESVEPSNWDYGYDWHCTFTYASGSNTSCGPSSASIGIYARWCDNGEYYNDALQTCVGPAPDDCESSENPVQVSTGNKLITEEDYPLTGNSPLQFVRHYQSRLRRWQMPYRQYLSQDTRYPYDVFVRLGTGSGERFIENEGVWGPVKSGMRSALEMHTTGWNYTDSSGDQYRFDTDGKLVGIAYADGRSVTLGYPLTTPETVVVTDEYGNVMTLTLDAAGTKVVAMTDSSDAQYRYQYTSAGQLEYVSFPDATPQAPGANPFGEDNPFRRYHYAETVPGSGAWQLTAITDENGEVYKTIAYDTKGRVKASGLADGSIGNSTFDYSKIGSAVDSRVTVTNPYGKKTIYHRDIIHGIAKVTEVEGVEQPATACLADVRSKEYYPENGWVKYNTDKAGNKTYYEYFVDGALRGLLKKRIEGEGSSDARTFTFQYFPDRQLKEEILEGLKKSEYTYHGNGRLHTRTETDLTNLAEVPVRTWTTTYTYHDPGDDIRVATMTVDGPRSDVPDTAVTEYNPQGVMVKTTNGLGQVTLYENHNGRGQPQRMIDSNNIITHMEYTARGWLETTIQDVGGRNALTSMGYDNVGQLTDITLPDGMHVEFKFDAAHRLYETSNDLGQSIRYVLDLAGNQDEILYRDDQQTVVWQVDYDFDGLGRLWKEFGAYGQQTEYTHDENDQLAAITATRLAGNLVTAQDFDAHNRLAQVTDADQGNLFMDYDAEDRITQVTDQRGLVTSYVYDGFGDLQQLLSPDTGSTYYDYDAAGNRTRQADARGVVTHYTYDALNRLKTVTYPDTTRNVTYTYDNYNNGFLACTTCNGRLSTLQDSSGTTLYTYDALGRMDTRVNVVTAPGVGAVNLVTNFNFNAAGRLEQITYPNGQIVKYGFDAAGQVAVVQHKSQVANDALKTIASNITYQPFGPMRGATYGNSRVINRTYDLDGRLDTQSVSGVQALDYDYDDVNNIRVIDNLVDDSRDEAFTYDKLNRLQSASGKYGSIRYDYDPVGNRESRTIMRGAATVVEDHQIDANSNRLDEIGISDGTTPTTREFRYDDAGNLIEEKRADGTYMKPVYDDTNRMISVSQ